MQPKMMYGELTIMKYLIMAFVRYCAVSDAFNTCKSALLSILYVID